MPSEKIVVHDLGEVIADGDWAGWRAWQGSELSGVSNRQTV